MRCAEAKPLFSNYIDGAISGSEMHQVSGHLQECGECRSEYAGLENTRSLVASLGRRQPPPDLALKIRVAISNEHSRQGRRLLQSYMVRVENAFSGLMFPATAGILSAVVFIGSLIGML